MTEDKLYKVIKQALEDSYLSTDSASNSTIEEYLSYIGQDLEKILKILQKKENQND